MGRFFTYKDSSHLAVSYSNLIIHRTDDKGTTWYPINTPEYSVCMFVTDENEIIAQNQNGWNLHKSSDDGISYKHIFTAGVAYGTSSKKCFQKFKDNYYVLAPGGGVWKTKDFGYFEELVTFSRPRRLFVDHRGILYATGFNYSNTEPDPTYIIPPQQ